MRNIKLTLAYDGSEFSGWQIQPNQSTVQGELVSVLRKITQERIFVHGAGRTDAGVHALGQVAHFRTHSGLSPGEFQRALNALLPPAIRVVFAEEVEPGFHARHQTLARTYRYRIFRGRVVPPFLWKYVLHYPYPLDEPAMLQAAPQFAGEHDFAAFAASSGGEDEEKERSTVRTVFRSELLVSGGDAPPRPEAIAARLPNDSRELVYLIRGKSFLRYMVRKIVGTLLEIGRGRLAADDIPQLFELRDRSKAGPTVPPSGLCLLSVEYPEPWRIP